MRMRDLRDERGATLAIVTLSLFALFGMVVLVVDVGGLLTLRRRMVTTADAAVLAAAQSCAREDAANATAQADRLAKANVENSTRTDYADENCGTDSTGSVNVRYEAPKELFFAPLLGAPTSRPVSGAAKAIWGPTGGIAPVPIEFSVGPDGNLPCVFQPVGTQCNYWHDNSTNYGVDASSNWGFMNLGTWNTSAGSSCPSAGTSERRDWITGDVKTNVTIQTSPSYVCIDSGHSTSSWYSALQSQVGRIKHFPVNDPAQMITSPPGKAKYAIIGFAALRIDAVLRGNDSVAVGTPGTSGRCTSIESFTPGMQLDLDSLGCYPAAPDEISNLNLFKKKTAYREGIDYSYDPEEHILEWLVAAQTNVNIEFDWANEGTPGACGFHDPDPNAVCLAASWQGVQIGGSLIGGGHDFGLRAVRLVE